MWKEVDALTKKIRELEKAEADKQKSKKQQKQALQAEKRDAKEQRKKREEIQRLIGGRTELDVSDEGSAWSDDDKPPRRDKKNPPPPSDGISIVRANSGSADDGVSIVVTPVNKSGLSAQAVGTLLASRESGFEGLIRSDDRQMLESQLAMDLDLANQRTPTPSPSKRPHSVTNSPLLSALLSPQAERQRDPLLSSTAVPIISAGIHRGVPADSLQADNAAQQIRTELNNISAEAQNRLEEAPLETIPLNILGNRFFDTGVNVYRYGTESTAGLIDCLTRMVTVQNHVIKDLKLYRNDIVSIKRYVDMKLDEQQLRERDTQAKLMQDLVATYGMKSSDIKGARLQKDVDTAVPLLVEVEDVKDSDGNVLIPARTLNLMEYPDLRTQHNMTSMINTAFIQIYGDGDRSVASKALENVSFSFKNEVHGWGMTRANKSIRDTLLKLCLRLYSDGADSTQQVVVYDRAKHAIRRAPIELRRPSQGNPHVARKRTRRRRQGQRSLDFSADSGGSPKSRKFTGQGPPSWNQESWNLYWTKNGPKNKRNKTNRDDNSTSTASGRNGSESSLDTSPERQPLRRSPRKSAERESPHQNSEGHPNVAENPSTNGPWMMETENDNGDEKDEWEEKLKVDSDDDDDDVDVEKPENE